MIDILSVIKIAEDEKLAAEIPGAKLCVLLNHGGGLSIRYEAKIEGFQHGVESSFDMFKLEMLSADYLFDVREGCRHILHSLKNYR